MSLQAYATGSMLKGALAATTEKVDLYYESKDTIKHSERPMVARTNVIQGLTNLNGSGTSTILVSPQQGVSSIMMALKLPARVVGSRQYRGIATPKNWGWAALVSVQFRYANSSMYTLSGRQMMINAIQSAKDQRSAEDLMDLSGQELIVDADYADDEQLWAYIPICLPHAGAEIDRAPLPSEALDSPIQLLITLRSPADVLTASSGGTVDALPTTWEKGFVQVKQHIAATGTELESPRGKAHHLLADFYQQENSLSLDQVATPQSVNLVGFRAGSVKQINMYATPSTYDKLNPLEMYLPKDIKVNYMGTQLYVADGYSSQFWSVLFSNKPSRFNGAFLVDNADGTFTSSPKVYNWVQVPFQASYSPLETSEAVAVPGISVSNGIVSVDLTVDAVEKYSLFYHPVLLCSLVIENGNLEYIF
jgi:hypothetical protein